MKYFRLLVLPLTLQYSFLIFFRNKLYDLKFLKITQVSKPVISIGNISTGGTGKTPFVIYAAEYFLKKNKRVAIISRGYKRESKDLLIVYDGNKLLCDTDTCGDELFMLTEHLKESYDNFFVAACEDRVKAAKAMIDKFSPDVILLDDGFQHRKLFRNLDVVMIDAPDILKNNFTNSFLLPTGNLREPYESLKRGDVILQNNKSSSLPTIEKIRKYEKEIVKINYEAVSLTNHVNETLNTNGHDAIVFSGIASVDSFYKLLPKFNINEKEKIKFKDHHQYEKKDIDYLISKYKSGCIFVTTEKDFVKIKKYKDFIKNYSVYYLKIKINIIENRKLLEDKFEQVLN